MFTKTIDFKIYIVDMNNKKKPLIDFNSYR